MGLVKIPIYGASRTNSNPENLVGMERFELSASCSRSMRPRLHPHCTLGDGLQRIYLDRPVSLPRVLPCRRPESEERGLQTVTKGGTQRP